MNNMWSDIQVKSRPTRLLEKTPYKKEFSYAVRLTMDECLTRLHDLAKPQTGFWNPSSRTVKITRVANGTRFEVGVKRYSRGFIYNSATVDGIMMPSFEHPELSVIKGSVRLGAMIWFYLFVTGLTTLFMALSSNIIFAVVALAACFLFVRRDYNDYQQLRVLVHDTFQDQHAG